MRSNKIAENAGWDRERLAIEIPELAGLLDAEGLDLSILGFEAVEIDQLQTDFEEESADPQDSIKPNWLDMAPVTKLGDLWLLGNHRLMCGDARRADHISRRWRAAELTWHSSTLPIMCALQGLSVAARSSTPNLPWRVGKCRLPSSCASSAPS